MIGSPSLELFIRSMLDNSSFEWLCGIYPTNDDQNLTLCLHISQPYDDNNH